MKRINLFEQIWKEPISKISTKLNLEEYTLRKIIKDHDIPRPKSGYWAKLKHNKKLEKALLEDDPHIEINIDEYREHQNSSVRYRTEKLTKEIKTLHAIDLVVPQQLRTKHPLIIRAKKELDDRASGWSERIIQTYGDYLSISVQKSNIKRFLRIIQTLIQLLEKRGHSVEELHHKYTVFNISGEDIKLKFRE